VDNCLKNIVEQPFIEVIPGAAMRVAHWLHQSFCDSSSLVEVNARLPVGQDFDPVHPARPAALQLQAGFSIRTNNYRLY